MNVSDRIVEIIEDHESIVQTLTFINFSIEGGMDYPNYIPPLNNMAVSDMLSNICKELKKLRK